MTDLSDFNDWSVSLYELNREGRLESDLYFSDTSVQDADDVVNPEVEKYNNKVMLAKVLPEGWVVKTLGRVVAGEFHGDLSDLEGRDVVVKPESGTQGDGVRFARGDEVAKSIRSGELSSAANGVVTEHYHRHDYSNEIAPWGSNTIRALTYVDGSGQAHMIGAVHKWSTRHSGFIDNWSKGGVTTWVVNGIMMGTREDFSPTSVRPGQGPHREPLRNKPHVYQNHPETGVRIAGKVIPFWEQVESLVLGASALLSPEIVYAGWDVLVTPTGPIIIEVNPWPGVQLMQVHAPLLGDHKFRQFLRSKGVKGV